MTLFSIPRESRVAEYSSQVSQSPTVAYTTTDHLGSPRIITDQYGQVRSCRDFMPFGEDIFQNVGASRTAALNYSSNQDDIRQKFTGYQKDSETQLDFAEARMYENRFGRFTAVDPLLASGKSDNPQTFNRFVYVGNNPIMITDPLGLEWWRVRNKQNKTDNIFWSTDRPVGEDGDVVDKWTNYVYKASDGLWYSLDPNSDSFNRYFSQERAEWDNGVYTGFNGYGRIPVYGSLLTMISGIKTGNVGRSFQGFGELSVTFAMAPRTIGGILKEGAEEGLSYVSGLPITNPFSAKRVSNQDIVQRAADFADRKRIRQGFKVDSVGGTKAHGYSNDVINRYQRRFGNVGLDVENVSYKNGLAARYGEKGSIRFDVIDTTNGASYDFKFGAEKNWPALKPTRVDQLLRHGPAWVRSVTEINPVRR